MPLQVSPSGSDRPFNLFCCREVQVALYYFNKTVVVPAELLTQHIFHDKILVRSLQKLLVVN